ncbi:NAD(P)H-binding protein [Plantactinospora endophytica]|uniref:Nucleotide-diphosphate-sugar epimerase n=1 Tax=Plantactinospora endophytica TaxID=673535 RepID=A0ABQ4DXU6_9ACTN|nr:NAD(P)H-binding protein [Plantactinospora endophytica]GIG87285.1 nucleotide-diphosphate-sugar epimerase [Plantactinospora endophytica]
MGEKRAILVVGATGNVGREVVAGLLAVGAEVRALVRNPDRADLPDGATPYRGDLAEPHTVAEAAAGVDGVFLLWPFVNAERAPAVVDALAGPGRHVVYLSAMNVRDDQEPDRNGFWGEVERLIEGSGSTWTFLRAGGFAANTLEWADQIRATGEVRWVYGDAARSLVHERDIAAVAVRALTEPGHAGRKYVLTGPEPVTQAEQVRLIGEAVGRPVQWVEIPVEQVRQDLRDRWGDAGFLDGALAYWAGLVTEPEPVTRTVQEVTGVPARSFREWAIDHAADFAPLPVPVDGGRGVGQPEKGALR